MIAALILITLATIAYRAQRTRKVPDQTLGGRLVLRGPVRLVGWREMAGERRRILERERDLVDAHQSRCYRERLAKLRLKFEGDLL